MKTKNAIFLIISILFLAACNPNIEFKEYTGFSNYKWDKTNIITLKPNITDTASKYNLVLGLRHVYGFQFKQFYVEVEITAPNGKTMTKTYEMKIIENNEYLSDCSGDYCDIEIPVEKDFKFIDAGVHTVKISHKMEMNPVTNIIEFGLLIEKQVEEEK